MKNSKIEIGKSAVNEEEVFLSKLRRERGRGYLGRNWGREGGGGREGEGYLGRN